MAAWSETVRHIAIRPVIAWLRPQGNRDEDNRTNRSAVCEGVCRFEQDYIGGTLLAGGLWQKTLGRMDLKTASGCTTQVSTATKDLALAVQLARATSWILNSRREVIACISPAATRVMVIHQGEPRI